VLHNILNYLSSRIISVIKSRKTRWDSLLASMREMWNIDKTLVRRPEENIHLENLNVNERINEDVKWIQVARVSVQWRSWEHDNET
jgi:hypothetical protein